MAQAPALDPLVELLKLLFSPDELREWVHRTLGPEIAAELPGPGTGLAQLAFGTVSVLERNGLVNDVLFESLIKCAPWATRGDPRGRSKHERKWHTCFFKQASNPSISTSMGFMCFVSRCGILPNHCPGIHEPADGCSHSHVRHLVITACGCWICGGCTCNLSQRQGQNSCGG